MKLKKSLVIAALFIFMALPIASAQDTDIPDPGMTPDSPLWGLDKAMEKLSLAFTSDTSQRVEKRLANANERLAEIKAMVEANKITHAEKAEMARQEEVDELEKEIDNNAGIPADIKAKVLENLQKHVVVLQGIQDKLSAKNITATGISNAMSKSNLSIARFQAKPTRAGGS